MLGLGGLRVGVGGGLARVQGVHLLLDLFHEGEVVVVGLSSSPLERPVLRQLPEVEVLSGETLSIHEALVEVFGLLEEGDLLTELGDGVFKCVFLADERLEFLLHQKNYKQILSRPIISPSKPHITS